MAVILVTGSDGQLGNELKAISKNYYGYDFIFTDITTIDLTDPVKTSEYIREVRPGWIINCAAYNHVDKAESEPEVAMRVNSMAVKHITDAIKDSECRLIHFSSDYVYSGNNSVPYDEEFPPDPTTAYGISKLSGERFALLHPACIIIRTSWLYSSFGNNFLKTILKLGREQDTLNVVFDQAGTPTYAADLAAVVIHIVAGVIRNQLSFNSGIYNYSNEGVCSWFDFAFEIIREAGYKCTVVPVLSSEFKQAARRPSYSVMDKSKIRDNFGLKIPHWRESFLRCMKLMGY